MIRDKRRARRIAKYRHIARAGSLPRLCVNKTNQHVYAQLIVRSEYGDKVFAAVSTLSKDVREEINNSKSANRENKPSKRSVNKKSAALVGRNIAAKILPHFAKVTFDRSGFKYCGIIKALADAARDVGVEV